MPRAKTKSELLDQADTHFNDLWHLIDALTDNALNTEFDFSDEPKKTEAHWQRDKNLRDILIHLFEWHQLLIHWIKANTPAHDRNNPNEKDNVADFLPAPYTWKTYGDMNIEFWKKHQQTELNDAKKLVKKSHKATVKLVSEFTDDALFTKKYFKWTGTTSLGSYCVSALPSHYDWAIKKLKAHAKKVG